LLLPHLAPYVAGLFLRGWLGLGRICPATAYSRGVGLSSAQLSDAAIGVQTRSWRLIGRDCASWFRFVIAGIPLTRTPKFYTQICTRFLVNVDKRSRGSLALWCDQCIRVNYL